MGYKWGWDFRRRVFWDAVKSSWERWVAGLLRGGAREDI